MHKEIAMAIQSAINRQTLLPLQMYLSPQLYWVEDEHVYRMECEKLLALWHQRFQKDPNDHITILELYEQANCVVLIGRENGHTGVHSIVWKFLIEHNSVVLWQNCASCLFPKEWLNENLYPIPNFKDESLLSALQTWFSFYHVKELRKEHGSEVLALYQGNPQYFQHMQVKISASIFYEDLCALPFGKTKTDKAMIGLYEAGHLFAIFDLVQGYPEERTLFIGFFMMEKTVQGKGRGSALIQQLKAFARTHGFLYLRLGYVKGNRQSECFWKKQGFTPVGIEVRQNSYIVCVMQTLL